MDPQMNSEPLPAEADAAPEESPQFVDATIRTAGYQAATFSYLQSLRNKLVVLARLRPTKEALEPFTLTDTSISLQGTDASGALAQLECTADKVFPPDSSNEDVVRSLDYLLDGSLNGENNTILCYGPSRSGKTHTLLGEHSDGVLQSVIDRFFSLRSASPGDAVFSLDVQSFLVDDRDALFDVAQPQATPALKWRRTDPLDFSLFATVRVNDSEQLKALLQTVQRNAAPRKSRSLFFFLRFSLQTPTVTFRGSLTLVDLIASSYFKLKPASFDKTPSALPALLAALKAGSAAPDFTASSLVAHLRPSLTCGGRVAMIVHLNPAVSKVNDAVKMVRFLSRLPQSLSLATAPSATLPSVSVNYESIDLATLQPLEAELRNQVAFLTEEVRNCFLSAKAPLAELWSAQLELNSHRPQFWKTMEEECLHSLDAEQKRYESMKTQHGENLQEVARLQALVDDYPRLHEELEMQREDKRQALGLLEDDNRRLVEESQRNSLSKESIVEILDSLNAQLRAAQAELDVLEKAAKNPAFKKRVRKAATAKKTPGFAARPVATKAPVRTAGVRPAQARRG